LNSKTTKIPLWVLKNTKAACNGVFIFLIWFCWVYVCVCVYIYINGWRVFRRRQQGSAARALWMVHATPKQHWTLPSRAAFEKPHYPYHGGEARVLRWHTKELRLKVFPSLFLLSPRKLCWPFKNKQASLLVCLLIQISFSFFWLQYI
jgi:hypothetical protein